MKTCVKCNIEKLLSDYYKCSRNIDKLQSYCKQCRKIYENQYRFINIDQIKVYNKKRNSECKEYFKNYKNKRYNTDIEYKIKVNLRSRIYNVLKTSKLNKNNKTLNYIGCTIEQFKQYLESQFKPEMNWDNHGEVWEIDHIISCYSFDLNIIENQFKCFHYTNMRPLFKTTEIAESLGYIDEIGNQNREKK